MPRKIPPIHSVALQFLNRECSKAKRPRLKANMLEREYYEDDKMTLTHLH